MKTRYSSILLILFSIICIEYGKNLTSAKAEEININSQKEYFSRTTNPTLFSKKNNFLIQKSFYGNGYTFEESLKLKNQILDLLGISFKSKKTIFSFPEQRIESDAFSFWNTYKDMLRNQIPKNPKITNDLDNSFGKSLLR